MDRKIERTPRNAFHVFGHVAPIDIVPYGIACILLAGEVYILLAFISIVHGFK